MPILQYLFGVGGALLCLMFVLNAYVPTAPPREQRELDKSTIHVTAAPTGDFVIDHFPAIRGDLADAANDAVKKAMAMMPPEDAKQVTSNAAQAAAVAPQAPRKRRLAQRPQSRRFASAEAPSPARGDTLNGGWSNNNWSRGWSNNSNNNGWSNNGWSNNPGNWNSNWSHGWGGKRWADNQ
jgi:hypothetical protein